MWETETRKDNAKLMESEWGKNITCKWHQAWGASIRAEDAMDQPLLRYGDACGHQDAVSAGAVSETKELFSFCSRQGCDC